MAESTKVTPNTTAPVTRTEKARISEKTPNGLNYRVTAIDTRGDKIYFVSAVAFDVESRYKKYVTNGYTSVMAWSLKGDYWHEDGTWMKTEKAVTSTAKATDEKLISFLDNLSTAMKSAAGHARKGSFSDELGQELYDDCQSLFKHLHISGSGGFNGTK